MRGGDFSSTTLFPGQNIGTDPAGNPILNGAIYDPATRTTLPSGQIVTTMFPGNKIPTSRFDPVAVKIQNLIPQPSNANPTANYAQLYPTHTAALILVDGPLFKADDAKGFIGQTLPKVTGKDGMKGREAMIRGMFSPTTPPALQDRILKMMLSAPEATARGAMSSMADPEVWNNHVLKVPTLAIFAGTYTGSFLDTTKTYLPDLQFLNIPGTGHFLMLEKPAEFNQYVMTFIDRQKS